MTLTLLLDIDGTILDMKPDVFIPVYFQSLAQHLNQFAPVEKLIPALVAGRKAMNGSEDPRCTLEQVFETEVYSKAGPRREEFADIVDDFLIRIFPTLAFHARQKPEAIRFVDWALSSGYRLAIAADPIFPQAAVEERIRWAGLNPDQFSLIASADHFHFTKSHPAYFAELLGRLGWPDDPVLMVGTDFERDVIPARRLGLKTFLVESGSISNLEDEAAGGAWAELRELLRCMTPSDLEPSFKTRDAILGLLASTPAVLAGMCGSLTAEEWGHEPALDDWAMTEIVCHLRDTEREVHALQLDLMLEKPDAFIPRPETDVWASERDYLREEGSLALEAFVDARIGLVNRLKSFPGDMWSRRARHAIFGPTNFLEIMSFAADHDRLHLQQAWKTLQSLQVGASI